MQDLESKKIGELVAEDYRKATVFKKHGIDFCCGGGITIAKACEKNGVDKNELLQELKALETEIADTHDYNSWELDFLVDYIVNTHHNYVKVNIPMIRTFANKVSRVHGGANPEVVEINHCFEAVAQELSAHMQKEEMVLFPFIKNMASHKKAGTTLEQVPFGTVANPIRMMEHEHDNAGDILKKIASLSNNYTPPDHACNTYKVLYANLRDFESDLHKHIHLENNILFPKAIELEQKLMAH